MKADRPVMFDLTDVIELKATSEDSSVLDALAHAKAHRAMVRDFIPDRDPDGRKVEVSFATRNWQKAIRDRRRPGHFVRRPVDPLDLAQVSPYLTEHIKRFGEYSTHELGVTLDAYNTHLDVDFSVLGDDEKAAA